MPNIERCPSCNSQVPEGAIACMACGYLLTGNGQEPTNLCSDPACCVANPPGVEKCVRCGAPLTN